MVVPIGVFDHHFDLGVDGPGGANDQVAGGSNHHLKAVLGPGTVAAGRDVLGGLRRGEEKVVENELVEVPGGVLGDALHLRPVLGVGIREGLEAVGLVDRVGDAAGDGDVVRRKERLGQLQRGVGDDETIAVHLEIHLVHVNLGGDGLPARLQPGRIAHVRNFLGAAVDRHLEIVVRGERGDKPQCHR